MALESSNPQSSEAAHELLISNLRNAHAMETQVMSVLEAQLATVTDFPDLHARLTRHLRETRDQTRRLDECLSRCGASTSMVKDTVLTLMGMGQASVQGLSEDAVLKALIADSLTEQLEIASYRILIILAEMAGRPELCPILQMSLDEERAMADWLDRNLDSLAMQFVKTLESRQT